MRATILSLVVNCIRSGDSENAFAFTLGEYLKNNAVHYCLLHRVDLQRQRAGAIACIVTHLQMMLSIILLIDLLPTLLQTYRYCCLQYWPDKCPHCFRLTDDAVNMHYWLDQLRTLLQTYR